VPCRNDCGIDRHNYEKLNLWMYLGDGCVGTMDAPVLRMHLSDGCTGTMDVLGLWMRLGYGRVGSLRYTKYEEEIGWDFLTILEVK
jgi:hypothetical protein